MGRKMSLLQLICTLHGALGLLGAAPGHRRSALRLRALPDHPQPPAGDLVLIDGDNVRGKTGFGLSADGLVHQARRYAAGGQDAVLYIDHGLAHEALSPGPEPNCRLCFAGTEQSADDAIARDVAWLLNADESLRLSVVTSDSGLVARCRKAARSAPSGPQRLEIAGSMRFIDAVLVEETAKPYEAPARSDAGDRLAAVARAVAVSSERASLKRVKSKRRVAKAGRAKRLAAKRGAAEIGARLAANSAANLEAEVFASTDAELEAAAGILDAAVFEAAIRKNGGGVAGREKTWERVLRAASLHGRLRNAAVDERHGLLARFQAQINGGADRRADAKTRAGPAAPPPPVLRRKPKTTAPRAKLDLLRQLDARRAHASGTWPSGFALSSTSTKRDDDVFLDLPGLPRVVVVSDTHGFPIADVDVAGDVLVHAGDWALDGAVRNANRDAHEAFDAWLARQDFAHKVVLRGNHDPSRADFPLSNATYATKAGPVALPLANGQVCRVYCAPHGSYRAFGADLARELKAGTVDVFLSHAPPRGTLDVTYQDRSAGSKQLLSTLRDACARGGRAPPLWVCGHIHEAAGAAEVAVAGEKPTLIVNAAAANAGRAKRLERGFVALNLAAPGGERPVAVEAETPEKPRAPPAPAVAADETAPPLLLAVDLGLRTVGVACYDAAGALVAFASADDGDDGAAAVAAAAARCGVSPARPATKVVCEGTSRRLAAEAFGALEDRGFVAISAGGAPTLVDPEDWRQAVLAPKERLDAKKAKHAARLIARQLADDLPGWAARDLTTDAAEAVVLGAWAATELGWRAGAVGRRFSNGDLRHVAKRTEVVVAR